MSIPPLVCSTPPPLEQIESEDDVGQDDFAVQYGSSQDEDDDLCTYEHYQSTNLGNLYSVEEEQNNSVKPSYSPSVSPERIGTDYVNTECEKKINNILLNHSKTPIDEDNNIEDLDLKLEPFSIKPNRKNDSQNIIPETDTELKSLDIQTNTVISSEETNEGETAVNRSNEVTSTKQIPSPNVPAKDIVDEDEIEENEKPSGDTSHTQASGSVPMRDIVLDKEDFNDFQFIPTDLNLEQEVLGDLGLQHTSNYTQVEIVKPDDITILTDDKDFNDFDTFQLGYSTLSQIESSGSGTDHDPWKNDDAPINDFPDFQATFEENLDPAENGNLTEIDHSLHTENANDVDDDFGDFDDFKCSNSAPATGSIETHQGLSIKAFDFKNTDNESQIYESIERLIHSLYENDIIGNSDNLECNLESSLCETWGYLTETEVRQPYIINWNNSIGQKALLKSLCIDSRNILFGPKWNNMPRYAANLGPAPLQPLKPVPASAVTTTANTASHSEEDKSGSARPIESWSESLGNEGQEFTYAEALLLDLENLMATLDQMAHNQSSLKISELLSHACNDTEKSSNARVKSNISTPREFEQQVRPSTLSCAMTPMQINLPDTHIFTPTDSEVPRSQTIHNNNFTPIKPKISDQIKTGYTKHSTNNGTFPPLDNEYDDFQGFQDTSSQQVPESNVSTAPVIANTKQSINKAPSTESVPNFDAITYQTLTILEPIKLNPIMPELNWPEPGEVKETFDDFSDFVSSSSWSNFNTSVQNVSNQNVSNTDPQQNVLPPLAEKEKSSQSLEAPPTMTDANNEEPLDDFDNFHSVPAGSFQRKQEIPPHTELPSNRPSTSVNPPQTNGLLSPMVPLKMQSTPIPPPKLLTPTAQILQPIQIDKQNHGSQDKPNARQILQPLSLESFSQINWPSPGVDLQDLSRFNPIHAVRSLHQSPSGGESKSGSPARSHKSSQQDDDGWGDFVSIKPSKSPNHAPSKPPADDDDWSDFVCASKPNGVNTISFNVHSNFSAQKPYVSSRPPADRNRSDVPTLNYITPKTNQRPSRDSHFQNL